MKQSLEGEQSLEAAAFAVTKNDVAIIEARTWELGAVDADVVNVVNDHFGGCRLMVDLHDASDWLRDWWILV